MIYDWCHLIWIGFDCFIDINIQFAKVAIDLFRVFFLSLADKIMNGIQCLAGEKNWHDLITKFDNRSEYACIFGAHVRVYVVVIVVSVSVSVSVALDLLGFFLLVWFH